MQRAVGLQCHGHSAFPCLENHKNNDTKESRFLFFFFGGKESLS